MGSCWREEVIAIATQHIDTVIARLSNDRAFRMRFCQDPDAALESYLTPEEIRAIKTGDGYMLYRLGAGDRWEQLTEVLCGHDPGP